MEIKDVLKVLNLEDIGSYKDKAYIIDLNDSDEYGKYYSIIDKNKDVEYQEDSSSLTLIGATLVYTYKDYLITLYADYEEDEYRVVIKKVF